MLFLRFPSDRSCASMVSFEGLNSKLVRTYLAPTNLPLEQDAGGSSAKRKEGRVRLLAALEEPRKERGWEGEAGEEVAG